METTLELLDLSGKKIKKLNKAEPNETEITTLILDENELQKLDNIDTFTKIEKLSVIRNQLIRMYGISRLHNLTTLNLAHNSIVTIEGLKELVQLKKLCLAGNKIKIIDHLNMNVNLEHIDLSENGITNISDISYLKNLRELCLHGNRISHLRQCERYLPSSLVTLTLASNNITDLNEISQLVNLINLNNFSITKNPCVTDNKDEFDYRPFVINWLMGLKVIDGYVVDAIESLRAEWLYSQGRGRHFQVGDHQELVQYLASVCPPTGATLETEYDRKLRLILSKAQHHQQQLRQEQLSANGSLDCTPIASPGSKRRINPRNPARPHSTPRGSIRSKSPDRMVASCVMATSMTGSIMDIVSPLMTQSLDPTILSSTVINKANAKDDINGQLDSNQLYCNSPLQAATKLVPVPESLMSPDYRPNNTIMSRVTPQKPATAPNQTNNRTIPVKKDSVKGSPKLNRSTPHSSPRQQRSAMAKGNNNSPLRQRKNVTLATDCQQTQNQKNNSENSPNNTMSKKKNSKPTGKIIPQSSDDDSEMCDSKLETIRNLAIERRTQQEPEQVKKPDLKNSEETAALFIQKMWRGYYTRNKDKEVVEKFKTIKDMRTKEHIDKLTSDMETTKAALESERKIQVLQMQAINALWKKVSTLNPGERGDNSAAIDMNAMLSNAEIVTLSQNFSKLNCQVRELQGSMQEVMKCMRLLCQIPVVNQQLNENGIATQTEISAVHTPQGEAGKLFPFNRTPRPSSLPLPVHQRRRLSDPLNVQPQQTASDASAEVQQFAGSLVDDAIKTVAETNTDSESFEEMDKTVLEAHIFVTDTDGEIQTSDD